MPSHSVWRELYMFFLCDMYLILLCSLPLDHCCLSFNKKKNSVDILSLIFFYVEWLCDLTVLEIACRCVRWMDWYSWMLILIVRVSIFSCSFSVKMYCCTALSAVCDWICAWQVFITIPINQVTPTLALFVNRSHKKVSSNLAAGALAEWTKIYNF